MKHNHFLSFLLLISLLLSGCTQDDPLEGHWHLINLDSRYAINSLNQKEKYGDTFDFPDIEYGIGEEGEQRGIWGKDIGGHGGMQAFVYKNEMTVGPSCFGGNYTFKIENDSLKVFDYEKNLIHIGYKCANGCCEKQRQRFI